MYLVDLSALVISFKFLIQFVLLLYQSQLILFSILWGIIIASSAGTSWERKRLLNIANCFLLVHRLLQMRSLKVVILSNNVLNRILISLKSREGMWLVWSIVNHNIWLELILIR